MPSIVDTGWRKRGTVVGSITCELVTTQHYISQVWQATRPPNEAVLQRMGSGNVVDPSAKL